MQEFVLTAVERVLENVLQLEFYDWEYFLVHGFQTINKDKEQSVSSTTGVPHDVIIKVRKCVLLVMIFHITQYTFWG